MGWLDRTVRPLARLPLPLAVAAWLMVACGDGGVLTPRSGGRPFEVLVVADRDSLLATSLAAPMPGLPQQEPLFDVSVAPKLDRVNRMARSIVVLRVDSALYNKVKLRYARDSYASPQLVVYVGAPSLGALRRFLRTDGHLLTDLLTAQERAVEVASLRKKHNDGATRTVRQLFGVELLVPPTLTAMKRADGFLWLSDDGRAANRSLCLYRLPKRGDADGDALRRTFVHGRDSAMARNLPGERQGMYMQTAPAALSWHEATADGRKRMWVRGQWQMRGDAMGGPFVAVMNDRGDHWLVAEAFVYAPGTAKRNSLRQLEAALSTVVVRDSG